ncbi:transcriptional Coactivator p15-domain-containing protein [Clohesyomyces aquaticus]|uniref:Transcriptional Coactivator p15-domain-containing protein n=1 Tax=Clohesyomyces aquaticus TaxID=1231657 RepID=A0A1Y2A1P5_9PLEO|nr:transcriptional Coactivator p15-domain-containing protein [Clohesyomyces aquaticus]
MPGRTRGGFQKRGGYKKGFASTKRAASDDDDAAPQTSKRTKADDEVEKEEAGPLKLMDDHDGNPFVPLNSKRTRRANIMEFKGNNYVNIREYYGNSDGKFLPGKKGISLSIEQYNTLLAAAPLIESLLVEKGERTVRPDYSDVPVAKVDDEKNEGEEEAGGADYDEDEE